MRNVPSSLMLFVVILLAVACKNLIPGAGIDTLTAKVAAFNIPTVLSPAVVPANEHGFVSILRLERNNFTRNYSTPNINVEQIRNDAQASYNSIACQMDPALLQSNHLPKVLQ